LAKIIRSKNASPFITTYDLFCEDERDYKRIKESGKFTKSNLAKILKVDEKKILGLYFFDEVLGIKITIIKQGDIASGDLLCGDIFGMQQYVPLKDMQI
ncbi:MAG: DUF4387 family protein, partial [Deltaproteobacteria bacterium]|nr:DUF4387 family protein [Deltaproteobacteria bacterium]